MLDFCVLTSHSGTGLSVICWELTWMQFWEFALSTGMSFCAPRALCMFWTWTPINSGELPAVLVGGGGAKEFVPSGTKICRLLAFCISRFSSCCWITSFRCSWGGRSGIIPVKYAASLFNKETKASVTMQRKKLMSVWPFFQLCCGFEWQHVTVISRATELLAPN